MIIGVACRWAMNDRGWPSASFMDVFACSILKKQGVVVGSVVIVQDLVLSEPFGSTTEGDSYAGCQKKSG